MRRTLFFDAPRESGAGKIDSSTLIKYRRAALTSLRRSTDPHLSLVRSSIRLRDGTLVVNDLAVKFVDVTLHTYTGCTFNGPGSGDQIFLDAVTFTNVFLFIIIIVYIIVYITHYFIYLYFSYIDFYYIIVYFIVQFHQISIILFIIFFSYINIYFIT